MSLLNSEHVGKTIDVKGYCEVSDCWCRYCVDPLTSTAGATVRPIRLDVEACRICGKPLREPLADAGTVHALCYRNASRGT